MSKQYKTKCKKCGVTIIFSASEIVHKEGQLNVMANDLVSGKRTGETISCVYCDCCNNYIIIKQNNNE